MAHIATGLAIGIIFGSAIIAYTQATAPVPLGTEDLVSRGINEIIFPVGCSLVLFTATAMGKRAS